MAKRIELVLALMAVLLSGCNGDASKKKAAEGKTAEKVFPSVTVPMAITDPAKQAEYLVMHWWDDVAGVSVDKAERALGNFIIQLDRVPLGTAQGAVSRMFDNIVKADRADTAAHFYIQMTEKVSHYLYDPNSPYRNEDYYLPFALALSESPLTKDDMRNAFRFEARGCALNPVGSIAPDFTVRTIKNTRFRLSSVKAEYIMLFFSNPGCTACKAIIDDVMSTPYIPEFLSNGTLAVVNVYVDEDLEAWREYEHHYPSSWLTGYDEKYLIRGEDLYNLRAIPSLYLLDSEHRILMKDAPTEKVLSFLDNIAKQRYGNN